MILYDDGYFKLKTQKFVSPSPMTDHIGLSLYIEGEFISIFDRDEIVKLRSILNTFLSDEDNK